MSSTWSLDTERQNIHMWNIANTIEPSGLDHASTCTRCNKFLATILHSHCQDRYGIDISMEYCGSGSLASRIISKTRYVLNPVHTPLLELVIKSNSMVTAVRKRDGWNTHWFRLKTLNKECENTDCCELDSNHKLQCIIIIQVLKVPLLPGPNNPVAVNKKCILSTCRCSFFLSMVWNHVDLLQIMKKK